VPAGRRRKTTPLPVRLRRWGALTLPVLALAAVAVPVASAFEATGTDRADVSATSARLGLPERAAARTVSRSFQRTETAPPHLIDVEGIAEAAVATNRDALSPRWATDDLVVWSDPGTGSRVLLRITDGEKVLVTGAVQGAWAQIAHGDQLVWVRRNGLTRDEPATAVDPSSGATLTFAGHVPAGVAGAPCPDGSSVESGLTTNAIKVYRAVCAAFPAVSSWGGRTGSGGDHGSGHALDIMCSGSLGDAIAAYVREHYRELGVSYVIWSQHIWTVQRSSEGWRAMPDRGSTTANHYDHVHVTVY
jgi:hypothetical protein